VKDTFEVHILAFIKQRLVLIKHKIMAPPNVSDKDTRQSPVVLYQINAKQQKGQTCQIGTKKQMKRLVT